MLFLSIAGAVTVTLICLWPFRTLLFFFAVSDYGIKDTWNWNWKREKLWIELILIPVAIIAWWFLVGTYITLGLG